MPKKQPPPPITPEELLRQRREFEAEWRAFTGKRQFPDDYVEEAYSNYLSLYEQHPHNPNEHTMPAAIEFLGKVASHYLNRCDAEFIRIEESDTFER